MNSPFKTKPSATVLLGIKTLLASGAIAGTVGIWSMLSNQAVSAAKVDGTESTQDEEAMVEADAMPTLVSLIRPEVLSTPEGVLANLPPSLRNVSALPTATAIVSAPPVQTLNLGSGSSGAKTGNSSARKASRKKSAAKSKSS